MKNSAGVAAALTLTRTVIGLTSLTLSVPMVGFSEDGGTLRPLHVSHDDRWQSILPSESHLLLEPTLIEQFLDAIDGTPPDWTALYGHGHGADLDDRLFSLNRDRDVKRDANKALQWRLTFVWPGELSDYDPQTGGFRMALGPSIIPTRWGLVRFKPDEMPANLVAVPADPMTGKALRARIEQHEHVEITVAVTGRLVPEESIIYDFSHDGDGRGVVMPVVRVEQIDFVLGGHAIGQ